MITYVNLNVIQNLVYSNFFIDEQKYTLEDESFDDKFGCNTRMTLFKKNRDKLFQVKFLTSDIFIKISSKKDPENYIEQLSYIKICF